MLVELTITIMFILMLMSLIGGNNFIGATIETTISNTAIVDGDPSTFEVSTSNYINIDLFTTVLIIIIVIAIVAAVIGFKVLGSGLGSSSVKIILTCLLLTTLWTLFTLLTLNLIIAIEYFGWLIYAVLTILFTIGGVQQLVEAKK